MNNMPTVCITLADCDAHDNASIAVIGVYRHYPDLTGVDYFDAPRAVRIELEDGLGPFLDPYWSRNAIRPQSEIDQHLGKRVRVIGLYHKDMPSNPDDPSYASAMGGPCIEVESIEPVS